MSNGRTKIEMDGKAVGTVNLTNYDLVLISSSAGKDSQAMLDHLEELADDQGCPRDRLVVVHADLGERVEWDGTKELAQEQAEHYGLRFEVCRRMGKVATKSGKTYQAGEVFGDILDYAEHRGSWPSSAARWCTSEFKRAQIGTVITKLSREIANRHPKGYIIRVLNCMGMRAEESPARAKRPEFVAAAKGSTKTRQVDEWLPIQSWTAQDVWDRIAASGVRHHEAYDKGMGRLSCVFCIMASKQDLLVAGSLNPDKLETYVETEERIDHTFRQNLSMADIKAELETNGAPPVASTVCAPTTAAPVACDGDDEGDSYELPDDEQTQGGHPESADGMPTMSALVQGTQLALDLASPQGATDTSARAGPSVTSRGDCF